MLPNPSSAFVGIPSLVASSSGRAKNARYARLLPSTRNSSASRAGPSSSSSSAPVIVFGDMRASLCRILLSDETRRATVLAGMRLEIHPLRPRVPRRRGAPARATPCRPARREPALPAAYEQVDVAREAIEKLSTEHASGAVATRGGEVVGYLIGTPRDDPTWGPNVWVELAGHAVSLAEDVRDLYGLAATRWVDEGRTSHYAIAPAGDPALVDASFRLGFGQQHVHAMREVTRDAHDRAARRARDPQADAGRDSRFWPSSSSRCRRTSMRRPSSRRSGRRRSRRRSRSGKRTSTTRSTPPSSPSRTAGSLAPRSAARSRSPACTAGSRGPTTPASSASRPSCRRHVAPAPAGRSARRCSTGRQPRATTVVLTDWRATNLLSSARRGRSSGTARRFSACSARSPRTRRRRWLEGGTHSSPLGLAGAARRDGRRRAAS